MVKEGYKDKIIDYILSRQYIVGIAIRNSGFSKPYSTTLSAKYSSSIENLGQSYSFLIDPLSKESEQNLMWLLRHSVLHKRRFYRNEYDLNPMLFPAFDLELKGFRYYLPLNNEDIELLFEAPNDYWKKRTEVYLSNYESDLTLY